MHVLLERGRRANAALVQATSQTRRIILCSTRLDLPLRVGIPSASPSLGGARMGRDAIPKNCSKSAWAIYTSPPLIYSCTLRPNGQNRVTKREVFLSPSHFRAALALRDSQRGPQMQGKPETGTLRHTHNQGRLRAGKQKLE